MKSLLLRLMMPVIVCLTLVGCPPKPVIDDLDFTSAAANGRGRDNWMDGSAEVGMDDALMDEAPADETPVREVVEPDVIRQSGSLLYILNQHRGLTIVDLASEALLSQTPTSGHPRDLYLSGDRAYVLVSAARDITVEDTAVRVEYGSKIYVFDISDPERVTEAGSFRLEGDLVDSRLVGNVIYAVTSNYTWYDGIAFEDGVVSSESATKRYGSTGVVSVHIADPAAIRIVDQAPLPGSSNLIQSTNYAIFVATHLYDTDETRIAYVDIADPDGAIVVRGVALAPGYMEDRFKMDARNGVLRTVTNTWWQDRQTVVATFDISNPDAIQPLDQIQIEDAEGDTLFATRFDDDYVYIVTFFVVDPLFLVDVSDPSNITVLDGLKVPGWATHIEPRGDRLITLGVDDTDGHRVKVSLFDVGDRENLRELDTVSLGDNWSWSSAWDDVKAFTVLDDMILVPFTGWNEDYNAYNRMQFVSWTRDDLSAHGYVDVQGAVLRSFRYDDLYYAVTQEQLAVVDATEPDTPEVVNSLLLAENVSDVAVLENGHLVEVITRSDTGDVLLRAIDPTSLEVAGMHVLPTPMAAMTLVRDNAVVVVTTVFEYQPQYRGYYQVHIVDFSDVNAPVLLGRLDVDMEPWYHGWWGAYDDYRGDGMEIARADKQYWYYPVGDIAFLAGDHLMLRGHRSAFETNIGPGARQGLEGLAILNLNDFEDLAYVGLKFDFIDSMQSVGGLLYIASHVEGRRRGDDRAFVAYYLHTFDPVTLEASNGVNVPGVFLHAVPNSDLLLFQDAQYTQRGEISTLIQSVGITDNRATLLHSYTLDSGWWEIKADNDTVYCLGNRYDYYYYDGDYDDAFADGDISDAGGASEPGQGRGNKSDVDEGGSRLQAVRIAADGAFELRAQVATGYHWPNLLGVKGTRAYVSFDGAAVAEYDFSRTQPELSAVLALTAYPGTIRFGDGFACLPLGYSGIALLN